MSGHVSVRPIARADLPAVAEFLASRLGGRGGAQRYRRILEPTWLGDAPNHGFQLHDGEAVRGVLGGVYSSRSIDGAVQRFCNMTGWCVDEPHRHASLALLKALLAQPEYTFTNFSASPQVASILERVGFQRLDHGKLLFAWGSIRASNTPAKIIDNPREVRAALDDQARVIFDDHSAYACGQFVLEARGEKCHLVTVRRGRGGIYFADVLHASNPRLLSEHLSLLFRPLLKRHKTFVVGLDARLADTMPAIGLHLPRPTFFRGGEGGTSRISSIYSELVGMYG